MTLFWIFIKSISIGPTFYHPVVIFYALLLLYALLLVTTFIHLQQHKTFIKLVTDRQTDRPINRQIDKLTDRVTDITKDRQTDWHCDLQSCYWSWKLRRKYSETIEINQITEDMKLKIPISFIGKYRLDKCHKTRLSGLSIIN